jgi:hypothetical protein
MTKLISGLALILAFLPFGAFAQTTSLPNTGAGLKVEPNYPSPLTDFTVTLNDYSLPSQASSIKWVVNGQYLSQFNNQRSINLTALNTGESMNIEAVLSSSVGETLLSTNVNPYYLDIIVEPQTRVPSFYLGRPLPSINSLVNLTAILNGYEGSQADLLYTWRLNNKPVHGGPVAGKSNTSVVTPIGPGFTVSLEVANTRGQIITKRNLEIRSVTPKLVFYQNDYLLGLSNKAYSRFNLVNENITLRAEPYHMDIGTYNNPGLLDWKIDRQTVSPNADNPYEITLYRSEKAGFGASRVSLHVRNLTQVLQGVEGEFTVNY